MYFWPSVVVCCGFKRVSEHLIPNKNITYVIILYVIHKQHLTANINTPLCRFWSCDTRKDDCNPWHTGSPQVHFTLHSHISVIIFFLFQFPRIFHTLLEELPWQMWFLSPIPRFSFHSVTQYKQKIMKQNFVSPAWYEIFAYVWATFTQKYCD